MNEPRKHHYLPKFYLRGFATSAEKLMQADRHRGRAFGTSVDGAGAIKDFHRLDYIDADEFLFEKQLAEVEGLLATCLKEVLDENLIREDKRDELVFLAAQLRMRVPAMHNHVSRALEGVVRSTMLLMERRGELPTLEGLPNLASSVNIVIANWKCLQMMFGIAADPEHLAFLGGMSMSLLRATGDCVFLTSDQPVSIFEPDVPTGLVSGFSSAIEITLPLDRRLALQFKRGDDQRGHAIFATDIDRAAVDEINRRTVIMAERWVFGPEEFPGLAQFVSGFAGQSAGLRDDVIDGGEGFYHLSQTVPVYPESHYAL